MSTEDTSDLKRFEDADRYMQRCDDCGNAGFPHLCGFHDGNHR